MAEELALEQGFGNRRAVDGDEWLAAAIAGVVDEPCEKFFAGAALGFDQDVGAGAGRGSRALQGAQQGRRMADDVAVGVDVFSGLLPGAVDDLGRGSLQAIEGNGLGEVIERTVAHGVDCVGDGAVGGEQNDGGFRRCLARSPHDFHAGAVGHAHIGDDQIEVAAFHVADRFAHAGGSFDAPAVAQKIGAQRGANARFVVDHHYGKHFITGHRAGNSN